MAFSSEAAELLVFHCDYPVDSDYVCVFMCVCVCVCVCVSSETRTLHKCVS